MKLHLLDRTQKLPISLARAWDFFSDAPNLARITPPWMGFEVTSPLPERMYAGMIVVYRVRPLLGVPLRWVTEITHVDEPRRFVDEQRFGPYRFWHHEHRFSEIDGGVEMRDLVHYALAPGGGPVRRFVVTPRLNRIFDHRRRVLEEMFGPWKGDGGGG
ncbi:SRPBCC family protein [Longimicrobium sp.]|uniref:SRPBCC family protein n=1 Tax=Longimicrobium sp. TaxID=2029185 RepID=UPI002BE421A4|nr:SRPBCC family protein [Longimicrobium sp.]HSU17624.1 SRPBCC family protein [Longimicrobium sp.]